PPPPSKNVAPTTEIASSTGQRRPVRWRRRGQGRMQVDDPRRWIPRTDHVLAEPPVRAASARLGDTLVKEHVRDVLQRCRDGELTPEDVVATVVAELPRVATGMRAVINGTGVIVHTNLGRAPLSPAAREAIDVAAG